MIVSFVTESTVVSLPVTCESLGAKSTDTCGPSSPITSLKKAYWSSVSFQGDICIDTPHSQDTVPPFTAAALVPAKRGRVLRGAAGVYEENPHLGIGKHIFSRFLSRPLGPSTPHQKDKHNSCYGDQSSHYWSHYHTDCVHIEGSGCISRRSAGCPRIRIYKTIYIPLQSSSRLKPGTPHSFKAMAASLECLRSLDPREARGFHDPTSRRDGSPDTWLDEGTAVADGVDGALAAWTARTVGYRSWQEPEACASYESRTQLVSVLALQSQDSVSRTAIT